MSKDFDNLKISLDLLPKSELKQGASTTQAKWFNVLAFQLDELDFVSSQLRVFYIFSKLSGVNLDIIGDIVGVFRAGLSDTDYRLFLEIIIDDAKQGSENILRTMKRLAQVSVVGLTQLFPASYQLNIEDPTFLVSETDVKNIIQAITPEGIKVFILETFTDGFGFDAFGGDGFADEAIPASGGKYSGFI